MTERALNAEKRLTILLANKQALRLQALPRPLSWIRRLFRRAG